MPTPQSSTLWTLPLLLLLCIPTLTQATPSSTPSFSLQWTPKHPLWEQHQTHRTLSFELLLQTPPQTSLQLRFAQLFLLSRGTTLRIHTFSAHVLLSSTLRWNKSQQWTPHRSTTLPNNTLLSIPFPNTIFASNTSCDTLLFRLFLKHKHKLLSKHITITPHNLRNHPRLSFPLKGRWWLAGGHSPGHPHRNLIQLRRDGTPFLPQRFAIDVLRVDKQNRILKGPSLDNNSYFGFGQPVYAPADGIVVKVQRGLPDQLPGHPDNKRPLGNTLLIQHTPHLFSLLAHLQHGSIRVKQGQKIKAGQRIAQVGNSGNGSTPHLHFQLLDHIQPQRARSLPAHFWNISPPHTSTHLTPYSPLEGSILLAY